MSARSRLMQPGDWATTDYNGIGTKTIVQIVERDDTQRRNGTSQSGVMFRVQPTLRNGREFAWYDSDWFEPLPPNV